MKQSIQLRNQMIKCFTVLIIGLNSVFSFAQQTWIEVETPDPSATRNMLRDIGGTSSNDVWTVGSYETTTPGNMKNLILHWDGNDWQTFTGTDQSTTLNDLWGVTAISATDVWAAGAKNTNANTNAQLIHWNGSSWTHTNLPMNPGGSFLDAIHAIAANDIWAVGGQAGSPTRPSYAIHYDGSNWTEVSVPNVGVFRNRLYDVDGVTSNDIWAVGTYGNNYGDFHAMAQHWNGSNWSNSPLPVNVTTPIGELYSVTMIASNDVWAVGSTITGDMLMIHYDGSAWSEVATSGAQGGAVVARPNDLFSVGARISEWDGSSWTVIDSMNQIDYGSLSSAVKFSNGDIWAAGVSGEPEILTFVYRTSPGQAPLAVSMSEYSIIKEGTSAKMQWSTTAETNANEFVMERSSDGVSFIHVNQTSAVGTAHNYELMDDSPLPGVNYYRLKLIDFDGSITLFPIKVLNFENVKAFSLFPNPVRDETVTISLRGEGERSLVLYNHIGQELQRWIINDEDSVRELDIPKDMTRGMYILTMMKGEMVWSEKLIVE